MKLLNNKYLISLLLCLIVLLPVNGQEILSDRQPEVKRIIISGNRFLDKSAILETFATKESPCAVSKFLYNVFGDKFGSKAEFFSQEIFEADIERLKLSYADNGFFDANIQYSISGDKRKNSIYISITIEENRQAYIDSVEYRGITFDNPKMQEEIFTKRVIKKGIPYQKSKVNEEANRVLGILMNYGYSFATLSFENSSATRTASSGTFLIIYAYETKEQCKFGEINLKVVPPREDITDKIVLRQLEYKQGDLISRKKITASERNLNRLGIFESARIEIIDNKTVEKKDSLVTNVFVKLGNKHELTPELIISDEDNAFNLGLGTSYTNRNFLGDARIFSTRLRFSTQSIHTWNFERLFGKTGFKDQSILLKAEFQFQVAQPHIFMQSLNGFWTFSLGTDKKNYYVSSIVRNKIGLVNQFTTYTTGFVEWILERSNVNWLEDTVKSGLSSARLKQEEKPQFNSIISVTLQRDKTNDIFSPTEGFFHAISAEESGLLQQVLKNIQPSLPYTQFYKFTILGKWYKDLSGTKFNILAIKLRVGYQDKYGESKRDPNISIPLNRRFFAGGSGSVRAWKTRELAAMPVNEIVLGGNIILEGNTELRINHMRGFGKLWFLDLQNLWAVYFIDYGSVWRSLQEFKPSDIAIAGGFGIRYDTFIGPVRLDYGFRIYDPGDVNSRKWFYEKKFFKDILNNGVLNFGIGHAF
jgi:outer membrane protein insertion porin family